MGHSARLLPIHASDEAEFIAAALRSRKLHGRWVRPPSDAAGFRQLVQRMEGTVNAGFVLRRGDTSELAGFMDVTNIIRGAFQNGYVAYYAFAGHDGQGFMRSGLEQLVRKAFTELKLHRLEANIQPGNLRSIALVRSCGFEREGYSPRYLKIAGRWRDHERWAILAS